MQRLKRFRLLTEEERSLLVRVLVTVVAARVSLWMLPVEAARKMTRAAAGMTSGSVEQVVWAVTLASRFVPGASCLTQAIAAQAVLARSGIASQVQVGVCKNQSRFHAHAWVVCHRQIVLGGRTEHYNTLLVWEPQE
jgi:Transglutaminase-like superfamily